MRQKTIRRSVSYTGVGLHSGTHNTMTLYPAEPDTGIVFRRIDLPGEPYVPAAVDRIVHTTRCTVIGEGEARVSTIEHLMAALRGLGVDNARVEIDGPEVPIADGSAREFVRIIEKANPIEQDRERRILSVAEPVWVRSGEKLAVALPYEGFKVSFTFANDHGHPALGDLFSEFDVTPDVFREEIAPARTIGWLSEVEALKEKGLALGATMEMAVVLSESEILTPLRFSNEPVRHKILDTIGDLFLAGYIHGHVVLIRSGHELNRRLARALVKSESVLELR